MANTDPLPLPRGWTKTARSSVLHAISLAFTALTRAWSSSATSRRRTTRLEADLDRAATEIELLKEELAIKDDRLARVPPRRRPHYGPTQRMRILKLKAARGWSTSQAAKAFAVTEDTITSWLRRVDEEGERALVQLSEPVNKFPAFVGYLMRWLRSTCPTMGKVRIAQVLARAGLQLAATTVQQMLRDGPDSKQPAEDALTEGTDKTAVVLARVLKAKRPDHIWHVDLTVIPTSAGFWVSWKPFSKLLRWPFCWWVAVTVDQFSRRVWGFALFKKMPFSKDVCGFLDRITKRTSAKPAHLITDKGRQFTAQTFKRWCRKNRIRQRYGAVGKHGSVAVIERFIRSMKTECAGQMFVPFRVDVMREELALYVTWYNEQRPHQGLDGMTPEEVYRGKTASEPHVRLEPRPRWPVSGKIRASRIHMTIKFVDGRRHLPVVELEQAA